MPVQGLCKAYIRQSLQIPTKHTYLANEAAKSTLETRGLSRPQGMCGEYWEILDLAPARDSVGVVLRSSDFGTKQGIWDKFQRAL